MSRRRMLHRLRLSDAGLRRVRLRAQGLDPRAGQLEVGAIVSALVGVQAQDWRAATLAVRARSSRLVAADVDAAAREPPSVVVTWSLRGTRHLHHVRDVRWIVGLLGPLFSRPGRRAEQLGIAGEAGNRAVRALRACLADGPLTRDQVKEKLATAGVDTSGQAPIHVIARAAREGTVCVVPGPSGPVRAGDAGPGPGRGERYVLTDDWIPRAASLPPEWAAAELARRYLAAYGPATVSDFATWSGLGLSAARAAWAAIAREATELETPRGEAWVLSERYDEMRGATRRAGGLRLLGAFDNWLLGYADRAAVVSPEYAHRVNPGGGMVRPIMVVDGQVAGTWTPRRRQCTTAVDVDAFRSLTGAEAEALDTEIADLRRFLEPAP